MKPPDPPGAGTGLGKVNDEIIFCYNACSHQYVFNAIIQTFFLRMQNKLTVTSNVPKRISTTL